MRFSLPTNRLLRWSLYVVLFLGLLGLGRVAQVGWESAWFATRAPYLQMAAPDGMTVRWVGAGPTSGRVRFGLAPDRLDDAVVETGKRKDHEVRLTGLAPGTRYYYAVDEDGRTIANSEDYWFVTPPAVGAAVPVRFWILGDSGYVGERQLKMRDAALRFMTSRPREGRPPFDAWASLGDAAYPSGTNAEFQSALFEPFGSLMRNYALWPVYGNHDARRWTHYDIFSLPTRGEAGGVASGTESWYSFDHGPVHVVVLDSEGSDRSTASAMANWLHEDLRAAVTQPWVLVLFHHPPYTKGNHDSDRRGDSGGRMADMRENLLPIFESYGVDLVLSGHSHSYERSHLVGCHYGTSNTFQDGMVLARGEQNAEFHKAALRTGYEGAVFAVVGSSSKVNSGRFDHPVMAQSLAELGSLVIDVDGNRLDAWFVDGEGGVKDQFAIIKRSDQPHSQRCKPD